MNYKDMFSYFKNNKDQIYFDSAATSIKFDEVLNAQIEYDLKIGANSHNDLFDNAYNANKLLIEVRKKVKDFLNADQNNSEVIFTSGTTYSLNQLAFGLKHIFKQDDQILLTELEHSSNLLPWMVIAKENDLKINYFELNDDFTINVEKVKNSVTNKTKVVTVNYTSNTIGSKNDIENIVKEIRKINKDTIIILDIAQSVAHLPSFVKKWDVDAVCFSTHKMYGPFGLGILWAKNNLLEILQPLTYGGGNNINITKQEYKLAKIPFKFEAGTLNLSAIYAFSKNLDILNNIKIETIGEYEKGLKDYFKQQLKQLDISNFEFYNLENDAPIILFNVKNVNAQDFGSFLNKKYKIGVRVGKHCARLVPELLNTFSTIRVSFSIYNTKQDIDKLILALKDHKSWIETLV